MQYWAFMWMPITCNDDTQLLIQSTCESCYSNAFRMLYLGHNFGRLWLKAEHGAHKQTRLLSILGNGPLYHHFFWLFFFFFFLFLLILIAAALLVARVTFRLKFAYGVHTQSWLLSNLNNLSRIYFITGTVQEKFSSKLEIFSTLFFLGFPGSATAFS